MRGRRKSSTARRADDGGDDGSMLPRPLQRPRCVRAAAPGRARGNRRRSARRESEPVRRRATTLGALQRRLFARKPPSVPSRASRGCISASTFQYPWAPRRQSAQTYLGGEGYSWTTTRPAGVPKPASRTNTGRAGRGQVGWEGARVMISPARYRALQVYGSTGNPLTDTGPHAVGSTASAARPGREGGSDVFVPRAVLPRPLARRLACGALCKITRSSSRCVPRLLVSEPRARV